MSETDPTLGQSGITAGCKLPRYLDQRRRKALGHMSRQNRLQIPHVFVFKGSQPNNYPIGFNTIGGPNVETCGSLLIAGMDLTALEGTP